MAAKRFGILIVLLLLASACSPAERYEEGLQIDFDERSIEGSFGHDGLMVRFHGTSDGVKKASLAIDIDGKALDVSLDMAEESLTEDAHENKFDQDDRDLLLALRDTIGEERPEITETLHGRLLVKVADRFAEVPIGPALLRRVVGLAAVLAKADTVTSGCGGDGVTCLPGTSGSSWAVFSAGGVCRAESTPYGDSACRGRCGIGCNWFDNDYTWDCLDHDVCLDYSSDCSDEFADAADDWAATMAPLCWSGTSRSKPPSVPVCGNGTVDVGEECDDHNVASGDACDGNCTWPRCGNRIVAGAEQCDDGGTAAGDGCSPTCMLEIPDPDPRLAGFGPTMSQVDEGATEVVPVPDLRVTLDLPAPASGAIITLTSGSPDSLSVAGSVTVAPGETSAQVAVSALQPSANPVTLTASMGADSFTTEVVVVPLPRIASLVAESQTIVVGSTTSVTVTIDAPARGEVAVGLALEPGTFATLGGSATAVIPDGATSATFDVEGLAAGTETLRATTDRSSTTLEITVLEPVPDPIDLGGWQLVQTASARTFTIPAGTMVRPGDVVVVARNADRAAFETYWGVALGPNVIYLNSVEPANGGAEWPSINGDETFELRNAAGESVDGPTVALLFQHGYQRTAPQASPGAAESWTSSASVAGSCTPGSGPSPSESFEGPYISEFSDATGAGAFAYEFVEITID